MVSVLCELSIVHACCVRACICIYSLIDPNRMQSLISADYLHFLRIVKLLAVLSKSVYRTQTEIVCLFELSFVEWLSLSVSVSIVPGHSNALECTQCFDNAQLDSNTCERLKFL